MDDMTEYRDLYKRAVHRYYESRRRQVNDEREERSEQVFKNKKWSKRRSSQKQESCGKNTLFSRHVLLKRLLFNILCQCYPICSFICLSSVTLVMIFWLTSSDKCMFRVNRKL